MGSLVISRRVQLRWLVCGLGLVCATSTAIRAEELPSFQHVVEHHYNRWTRGGQGILTEKRVTELVGHAEVRGAEAAAIASIHCYQRKAGEKAQPLTRAFLTGVHKEDPTLRRDHPESGGNLSLNYNSFLRHIQSAPRSAFAVERPELNGITQGHLADCYFVAGVGAAVHRNPDNLKQLIHHKDDHSYEVRFRNGKQVHVLPLTDAQLALGSNAGHQGIWLNILELAAGTVQEQDREQENKFALDTLGSGGDSVFTIQLLTGRKAIKHVIRRRDTQGVYPVPAERDIPHLVSKFTKVIHEGVSNQRIVCCGVGRWSVPPGMGQWHQYAIIDLKQGHVDIWNPWGSHFAPKGEPGLVHGYHTQGGRFSMPVHDFVCVFGAVNVESDQPIN